MKDSLFKINPRSVATMAHQRVTRGSAYSSLQVIVGLILLMSSASAGGDEVPSILVGKSQRACRAVATAHQEASEGQNLGGRYLLWKDLGKLYQDEHLKRRWPGHAEYILAPIYNDGRSMAVVRLGVDYGKGDQSMLWVVDDASYFTAESWKYIGEFAVVPRYYADTASDRSKHMRYYLSPQEPLPQNEPAVIEDVTYKSFGGQKGFEFYEFEGHIYLIVTQLYDKLTAVFEDQRNHPFELKCVIQR